MSQGPYRERPSMKVRLEMSQDEILAACRAWLFSRRSELTQSELDALALSVDTTKFSEPASYYVRAVLEYEVRGGD